jgi:hypothetical protein
MTRPGELHETHVCRDCGAEITVPYVRKKTSSLATHEHDWKDAPDWVVNPNEVAQECFTCRSVRWLRRSA